MQDRRTFIQIMLLGGGTALLPSMDLHAESTAKPGFTLWQIPSQIDTIGNSYVFLTDKKKVIVMDGGVKEEAPFLRGFLSALGGRVDAWFISHPHNDHMGALTEILKKPIGIKIKKIYHSRFSEALLKLEKPYDTFAYEFYAELDKLNPAETEVIDLREPGLTLKIDGLNLKVLGVTNEEFTTNPYNNSSMIIRVWDKSKSLVFLADAGVECGNKALSGIYAKELNCDYLQMAHHGQQGCSEKFYKSIKFRACLWPTPTWVWNNDAGKGINTHILKTFDTRRWMDEIGIKEHHVSCLEGLYKLD